MSQLSKNIISYLSLTIVALCCACPVLWQLITSLKTEEELTKLPPIFPASATLNNYLAILSGTAFVRILANSVFVALAATTISLLLGSAAGFVLAKGSIRGKGAILLFALSASMFPAVATISPLFLLIRALHLRDTLLSLILVYAAFSLPLTMWVMTSFFRALPDELLRSARVDGCTLFQAFRLIMLPLAAPGIGASAILVFLYCWNEFIFALTFTSTESARTIPVAIATFPGLHEVPWGEISAASMLAILPALLFVLVFQQRIVDGLTAGANKG